MRVKMPFAVLATVGRRLMETHRIREGNSEYLVVRCRDSVQYMAEIARIIRIEVIHASDVAAAANKYFERPDRPEGNHCNESIIFKQPPFVLALFDRDVVAQKAALV